MAKRGRPSADTLTGGSKDVNPQEFVIVGKQVGNDATTVVAQPLPIPRLPTRPGKNLVIELLWVQFFWLSPTSALPGSNMFVGAALTTNASNPAAIRNMVNDPRALALWTFWSSTQTLAGFNNLITFFEEDLTDGAGHGLLLATDTVYFTLASINSAQTNEITCRFGYRFKEVELVEYIGIVQSQQ